MKKDNKLLNFLAAVVMFVLYLNYRLAMTLVFTRPVYEQKDWNQISSKETSRIVLLFDAFMLSSFWVGWFWTLLSLVGFVVLNYLIFFIYLTYKRLRK